MIYDRKLTVCIPPEGFGAPFHGRLMVWQEHCCCELTVFHRRYWQALQAGSRADRMVQIPMGQDVLPTMYALLGGDPHLFRIEEAQTTTDEDGLPVTNLTLRREEANYDLCKPEDLA